MIYMDYDFEGSGSNAQLDPRVVVAAVCCGVLLLEHGDISGHPWSALVIPRQPSSSRLLMLAVVVC